MTFKEYLCEEVDKTSDEMSKNTIIRPVDKDMTVYDVLAEANPNVWTARVIGDRKYLFYNGKYVDITKTVEEIRNLYNQKGYSGYGFAKLDESEIVRYTKTKNVLMKCFSESITDEVDPSHVASAMFSSEPKDFDWKPEEYV